MVPEMISRGSSDSICHSYLMVDSSIVRGNVVGVKEDAFSHYKEFSTY